MYVPFKAGDIVDPGNVPSGEGGFMHTDPRHRMLQGSFAPSGPSAPSPSRPPRKRRNSTRRTTGPRRSLRKRESPGLQPSRIPGGDTLTARAAISFTPTGGEARFGAFWFEAKLRTDRDSRT